MAREQVKKQSEAKKGSSGYIWSMRVGIGFVEGK
jgi:hypothetical protein